MLGDVVGPLEGERDGVLVVTGFVGEELGVPVAVLDGARLGSSVGSGLGRFDGEEVGPSLGEDDGI